MSKQQLIGQIEKNIHGFRQDISSMKGFIEAARQSSPVFPPRLDCIFAEQYRNCCIIIRKYQILADKLKNDQAETGALVPPYVAEAIIDIKKMTEAYNGQAEEIIEETRSLFDIADMMSSDEEDCFDQDYGDQDYDL